MQRTIAVLAGDGIGPEVMDEGLRVLEALSDRFGHRFEFKKGLVGGAAFDAYGTHFPDETNQICKSSSAILFGSVGGPVREADQPKWKDCERNSLLSIRRAFNFNANFRPARVYPQLLDICPLKQEIASEGVDLLVVRELVGDLYFGEKKRFNRDGERVAWETAEYTESQVRAIAKVAFEAAKQRRRKLTSVDKANVLETSRLWREVVRETAADYPEVHLEEMLVDNCAMQIIRNPAQFDVIVTTNMFGDILSDAAAVLPGSLGLTPSASLNAEGFGFYEPSGGSAPDIAGKGIANPIAQILSAALMLRFSFGLEQEARTIEAAVEQALDEGCRTADIALPGEETISTVEMGSRIAEIISGSDFFAHFA